MREIKFRGRCGDEWHYGDLIHDRCNGYPIVFIDNNDEQTRYSVTMDTVGQFTGLKDADGREIYEGDIVHTLNDETDIGFVRWCAGEFDVYLQEGPCCIGYFEDVMNEEPFRVELTVIGNVYDNPELLKQN